MKNNKRLGSILVFTTLLILTLAGCSFNPSSGGGNTDKPVTISLNKTSETMVVGDALQLTATVNNASDKTVTWKSSDISFASVSAAGVVSALKDGNVTITATSNADKTKTASCSIKINPKGSNPASKIALKLNTMSESIEVGDSFNLVATVEGTDNKTVTWSSVDSSIASVDNNGQVTGVKEGTTKIVASSNAKNDVVSSCFVSVLSATAASGTKTFDIFAFNDTHGNAKDTEGKGIGIAKISTLLHSLSQNETFFIHQGDAWQGSVESNYTRGLLMTDWMNIENCVSMTVGNHEFDWGQEMIVENQKLANFPILGINVLKKDTNTRVDYLSPSTVISRNGLRIGVIGAIGNCLSSISSSKVSDVYFAYGNELSELVKAESVKLRNEKKCDFIVYSIHGSGSMDEEDSYDLSLSTGHYVDLVLEGHTHTQYDFTDGGGIYHIQGKANNESFYKITVNLNCDTDQFTVTPSAYETGYRSQYINLEENAQVKELFVKYADYYSFVYEDVGYNSTFKNSNELRQIISELYLEAGIEKWGQEYQISLGGGYLSCRGNGLDAGVVSYNKLAELFPFDNDVVLCSIRLGDLVNTDYFKMQNAYYFVTWSEYGYGVRSKLYGHNYDPNELAYVVSDTYGSDYAPNHLTVVDHLQFGGMYARDLLAKYIKEGKMNDDPGGSEETITHTGTASDPYSIEDVYIYGSTGTDQSLWGYYKGVIKDLSNATIKEGYIEGAVLGDVDGEHTVRAYRIFKSDPANSFATGWQTGELQVGDELVFYGGSYCYNGSPQFNSVNVAVKHNGAYTNVGETKDNPLNPSQLIMNADFGFETRGQNFYIKGNVEDFSSNSVTLFEKNVNSAHSGRSVVLSLSSTEGVVIRTTQLFYHDGSTNKASLYVEEPPVVVNHEGTIDDPKTIKEALALAEQYSGTSGDDAGAPRYFFVGTVVQQASRVGYSGDLGNVYVGDSDGSTILIYWLSKAENRQLLFEDIDDLKVGDVIVFSGQAFSYNGTTKEFSMGTYVYSINGVPTLS